MGTRFARSTFLSSHGAMIVPTRCCLRRIPSTRSGSGITGLDAAAQPEVGPRILRELQFGCPGRADAVVALSFAARKGTPRIVQFSECESVRTFLAMHTDSSACKC